MAMLQRRMASTIYAVRRSLERMRDRREKFSPIQPHTAASKLNAAFQMILKS